MLHPASDIMIYPTKSIADRLLLIVVENDPGIRHPKSKIAKICGISQSAVYQWFKGATKDPKAIHIATVCDFYKADCLWAILGSLRHTPPALDQLINKHLK